MSKRIVSNTPSIPAATLNQMGQNRRSLAGWTVALLPFADVTTRGNQRMRCERHQSLVGGEGPVRRFLALECLEEALFARRIRTDLGRQHDGNIALDIGIYEG